MAKLFKTLNPNFFNILSSPNQEIYVDCIFIIYDALEIGRASCRERV